jgi:hypothetical protein
MQHRYPKSDQFVGPIWRGDAGDATFLRFYNSRDLMMFRLLCPMPMELQRKVIQWALSPQAVTPNFVHDQFGEAGPTTRGP